MARVLPFGTVAVVGLAKNTGKTVTVNYLAAQAHAVGLRLGLTSTGRDGETEDVITALPKPEIALPPAAVLATARGSLDRGTAKLEILDTMGISNPLGEIVLARVREAGSVEISGPERTRDLKKVIQSLRALSDLVIVDGALDRIAASAPAVTGATVLATGAAVAPTLEEVVKTTVHRAKVLMTPAVRLTGTGRRLLLEGRSGIQGPQGVVALPFSTIIDAPAELTGYLEGAETLFLGGALSDELAALLISATRGRRFEVILRDATRIFVQPRQWQRLLRSGIHVAVLEPINLVAITVNPVDPRGRRFPPQELVANLSKLLPEQLILDPLAGGGEVIGIHR